MTTPRQTQTQRGGTPAETPAQLARFYAGLSIEEAAKRIRRSVPYLRRLERTGGFPLILAERCADAYGCVCDVFLYRYQNPKSKEGATRRQSKGGSPRNKSTETAQTGRRAQKTCSPRTAEQGNVKAGKP